MKHTLYPIPDRYFPAVKVDATVMAKVHYAIKDGKLEACDVQISQTAMRHITNTAQLMNEIEIYLLEREAKKVLQHN